LLVLLLDLSCKKNRDIVFQEPQKDLNALWELKRVTRNSADLTQFVDTAGFRLTLGGDQNFQLQGNNIPFLVNDASGTWSVDDPQYPYNITFTPAGNSASFSGSIATPVSEGRRTLSITFSPGCKSNTYVYTFEKAN